MLLKVPPAKTLPSVWTARERTKLFAFGSKAVSSVPSGVQPGDVVARHGGSAVGRERGELAADQNLAIPLDESDADRAVRVRIETVERGLTAHRWRKSGQKQPE